jgi:hypothetical protein
MAHALERIHDVLRWQYRRQVEVVVQRRVLSIITLAVPFRDHFQMEPGGLARRFQGLVNVAL